MDLYDSELTQVMRVGVELCIGRHEVVVWVMIIWAVAFIVPGQAICHTVCVTIHVLDGEIKVGKVFPTT